MKKGLSFFLKTFIPLGLGIYLIWFFFANMSDSALEQFQTALHEANYLYLGLSLLIGFAALVSRAIRWSYVLEPLGHKTPLWNRYHSIVIGYLINLTIPRAGEASRSVMLYRSDKVPFAKSFGTIVAERAIDLAMLATVGFITMYLGASDFDQIWAEMLKRFGAKPSSDGGFPWKYLFLGLVILGALALFFIIKRKPALRAKLLEFIQGLVGGIFSVFKSKRPLAYLLHTLFIWFCYLTMFGVCFYSLESTQDIPLKGILIAFIAGSIGITFTNGGIGTYPLLVGLVIAHYLSTDQPDKAEGIGNALGMLIWGSQTIMMIVLGLISLILIPKNHSAKNDEAPADIIQD
jgi:glycosyltransferase 2 family protein